MSRAVWRSASWSADRRERHASSPGTGQRGGTAGGKQESRQVKAAPCKASPFTTKPARVGKPSPRRSPGQPSSSQREGGYSFLYSPLFAFFMRTVSHTLARQHRRCVALFYIGDSLRFPAYNGNVMPSWYTIIFFVYGRVVYKPRCFLLFFSVRTFAAVCARIRKTSPTMSRNATSKAQREKPAFFLTGGQSLFYGQRFLAEILFLCAVLCGCAGVEGAFPCGGVPSWNREEKRLPRPLPARGARLQTEAEPGYFPPQTLRLSAGRSNHLWLFRWKNLAQFFPTLRCELTKKKGRGTMSTTR